MFPKGPAEGKKSASNIQHTHTHKNTVFQVIITNSPTNKQSHSLSIARNAAGTGKCGVEDLCEGSDWLVLSNGALCNNQSQTTLDLRSLTSSVWIVFGSGLFRLFCGGGCGGGGGGGEGMSP